ncbi:unnamed protein product [Linum trigynum]|uniref:FAS1 domain-containing protein n=1 Tax=Linum trigynum TaxID=586398 RepID=A0AAV2FYH9_9ROSI
MPKSHLSFLLLLFLHCSKTLAQSSPPPRLPTDTVAVLLKAGNHTTFARLIKSTHVDDQLSAQLNTTTDGITVLVPTDSAFSKLGKPGIDSLHEVERVELVQFHILPRLLAIPDFQTLSNPVKTLAGSNGRFTLTVATTDTEVTISTGVMKTRISGTLYSDAHVAVYEVENVLQPKNLFPPPAPAPEPAGSAPVVPNPKDASDSTRIGERCGGVVVFGVGFVATLLLLVAL